MSKCHGRFHQDHIVDVCNGDCCTSCGGPIDDNCECRCDQGPRVADLKHDEPMPKSMIELWYPKDLLLWKHRCSVTMYNMELHLSADAKERGLWFRLYDDDLEPLNESALLEWPEIEALHKEIGKALRKRKKAKTR